MHGALPDQEGQLERGRDREGPRGPGRLRRPGGLLKAVLLVIGLVAAFWASLLLSRTNASNSDGAAQMLQAWQMLHGHVRLANWLPGDVSFMTTEVPEYALIELVTGLNPDVVHLGAALTYTLSILLAALIAMGPARGEQVARGRERVARAALAVGIMIAPQLDAGTYTVLNSPDHFGTTVPVLVAWLIVDRCRQRWWVPVAVAVILAWTGLADETVLFIGVLPLAGTCLFRVLRARVFARQPLPSERFELALAAAGVLGAVVAVYAPEILAAIGGPLMVTPVTRLSPLHLIFWHNVRVAGWCLLVLAGAEFVGVHPAIRAGFEMLHLAGALVGASAIVLGAWRYLREKDLVTQLVVAGIVLNLVAFVVGTDALEITYTREISPVLTLGAALAGRILARRLLAEGQLARRVATPVLTLVLCGYLAGLAYSASQPKVPAQNQALATWLEAHHFRYGVSGYWDSSIVTVATAGQVQVRPLEKVPGRNLLLRSGHKQVQPSWFDPRLHYANFVVLDPGFAGTLPFTGFTGIGSFTLLKDVYATFGKPVRGYHYDKYTILAYDKNLLPDIPFHKPGNVP